MKTHRFTKAFILVVTVLLLATTISIFAGFSLNGSIDPGETSIWFSEKASLVRPPNSEDEEYLTKSGKAVASLTFYPEALSLEDMLERSVLVVRGKVQGFDCLTIKPVFDGSPMVHTDYYIELLDVLRGELAEDNQQITIRAAGGENDEVIVVNECLSLTVGQEYLFFLDKPVTGSGYNTEGDYYYISGGASGVFKSGSETQKNEQGISVPKTFYPYAIFDSNCEELNYLSFIDTIKSYNKNHPVDKMFLVNQYNRNIKANLESGFITQKEYEQSIAYLGMYASIVE